MTLRKIGLRISLDFWGLGWDIHDVFPFGEHVFRAKGNIHQRPSGCQVSGAVSFFSDGRGSNAKAFLRDALVSSDIGAT